MHTVHCLLNGNAQKIHGNMYQSPVILTVHRLSTTDRPQQVNNDVLKDLTESRDFKSGIRSDIRQCL